jgi:hypothetical protein
MKRIVTVGSMLAALAAASAGLLSAPSRAASPVATATPAPVPPAVLERLKSAGLDARAPDFTSRLKALAAQTGPAYVRSHVLSTAPVAVRKASPPRPSPLTASAAAGAARRLNKALPLTLTKGSIAFQIWDVNHTPSDLSSTPLASPVPWAFLVFVEQKVEISGSGSMTLSLGCAGLRSSAHALVVEAFGDFFKGTPWYFPSLGDAYPYWVLPDDFPPFAIGKKRSGTISITFDGVNASAPASFLPTEATVTIDVTIDHTPALGGVGTVSPWGSTGLASKNALLQNPATPRVGNGDWTSSLKGNDLVGDGVQVTPGWTITSTTIKSALSAAAPQDTSPENSWRGAKVTLPPQAGTLRTGVAWHYSGVDTLDYTVEWTLTGPLGVRPLLTMAKHDACED